MTDAFEWLNRLLSGEVPTEGSLAAIMELDEGQHLDFKSGTMLAKKDKRNSVLREYASAFSNSEGGILVFGVSDEHEFDPAKRIGNKPLPEWAGSVLHDSAHLLVPPPRFHEVQLDGGYALMVAFARTAQLVPAKDWQYWLRFGDSNREVPRFLLTDLMVGRRVHPAFKLSVRNDGTPSLNEHGEVAQLGFSFRVENLSLVPANRVVVGIIGHSVKGSPVGSHLEQFLEIEEPRQVDGLSWATARATTCLGFLGERVSIEGLGTAELKQGGTLSVPLLMRSSSGTLAAYVLAEGHAPQWFEISIRIQQRVENGGVKHVARVTSVVPVAGRRARVSWKLNDETA